MVIRIIKPYFRFRKSEILQLRAVGKQLSYVDFLPQRKITKEIYIVFNRDGSINVKNYGEVDC